MASNKTAATEQQGEWQLPSEGSPCWIEIPGRDIERLKQFYSAVFPSWGWKPITPEEQNTLRRYNFGDEKGLSGGIVKVPDNCSLMEQQMGYGMIVYYMVDSLDQIETRIHGNGGSTCLGKTEEGTNGWYMNFRDPEGNRFACYEMRRQ